jgi:hypothetical protein
MCYKYVAAMSLGQLFVAAAVKLANPARGYFVKPGPSARWNGWIWRPAKCSRSIQEAEKVQIEKSSGPFGLLLSLSGSDKSCARSKRPKGEKRIAQGFSPGNASPKSRFALKGRPKRLAAFQSKRARQRSCNQSRVSDNADGNCHRNSLR